MSTPSAHVLSEGAVSCPRDAPFSWDKPLYAAPTATASREGGGFLHDLFSVSWRSSEETHRAVLDIAGAMQSMRAHVNQDLRECLRARASGVKSLQVMEDTNVFIVFLNGRLNDDDKAVVKVRLLSAPDWPFAPAYVEAAVQLALHTLAAFCPHFAQMSFTLRGGGVKLPGWPLNKVVPAAQWSLGGMDIEVDGADAGLGEQSDLGDNAPVLFVVEEFLEASVDSWFKEALECVRMPSRHSNLPTALTHAACCLFQVVFALFSAQRWFSFQHNDLHHKNIRLKQEQGADGGACEAWTYSVPGCSKRDRSGDAAISFTLPGHVVRGRRVKIFDFGLSTLCRVHSVDLAGIPVTVTCFQPTAAPPVQPDFPLSSPIDASGASTAPHFYERHASSAEDEADAGAPNPDVMVDGGIGLFPLAAEDVRWFVKRDIRVPPVTLARAEAAVRAQTLLPLPLACDGDDAKRIPNLPMGREVPGYDLAVWVRHMLFHAQGFCGLVSAVQVVADGEELHQKPQSMQHTWAREFIDWVCQAAGIERAALQFIDGIWHHKKGEIVRGPRLCIPASMELVHFLRPTEDEQTSAPLGDPGAMQSLLEHAFLRRWLSPSSVKTCTFRDPDPAIHLTAHLTSIPTPTREERSEIQHRIHQGHSPALSKIL